MNFELLINNVQNAHESIQQSAVKAVNIYLTVRNWLIGYYIVEFEQNGEDRAKYGTKLMPELAKQLNIKGLGETNLKQSRKFFLTYPQISQTVSDLFNSKISQSVTDESFSSQSIKSIVIRQLATDLLRKPNEDLLFDSSEQESK